MLVAPVWYGVNGLFGVHSPPVSSPRLEGARTGFICPFGLLFNYTGVGWGKNRLSAGGGGIAAAQYFSLPLIFSLAAIPVNEKL